MKSKVSKSLNNKHPFTTLKELLQISKIEIPPKHTHDLQTGGVIYPLYKIRINETSGVLFLDSVLQEINKQKETLLTLQKEGNIQNIINQLDRILGDWKLEMDKIRSNPQYIYHTEIVTDFYDVDELKPWPGYTFEDVKFAQENSLEVPANKVTVGYPLEVEIHKPFYGFYLNLWFQKVFDELIELQRTAAMNKWPLKETISIKLLSESLSNSGLCANSSKSLEMIFNGESPDYIKWTSGKGKSAPVGLIVYFVKKIIKHGLPNEQVINLILNSFLVGHSRLNRGSISTLVSKPQAIKNRFFLVAIEQVLKDIEPT